MNIEDHSGKKYIRKIYSCSSPDPISIEVDIYCVLQAFSVTNAAVAHAIKKLLCAGLRNKGSYQQDLTEAIDAIYRGLQLETTVAADNSDIPF